MRPGTLSILILVTLAGLSKPASAQRDGGLDAVGTYNLETMSGQPLPFTSTSGAGHPCPGGGVLQSHATTGGNITLEISGRTVLLTDVEMTCALPDGTTRIESAPQQMSGLWRKRGANTIRILAGRTTLDFGYSESLGLLTQTQLQGAWRREGMSAPAASRAMSSTQSHTRVTPRCYSGQPPQPRSLAASDTAGVGQVIATAAPGYRLATEDEIACALASGKNGPPATEYGSWGQGEFWWSWEEDLNLDGSKDRILIVRSQDQDEPHNRLLVLMANGTSHLIGEGEPVSIHPVGEELHPCVEDSITLATPGIVIDGYFGTTVYWKGGKFEEVYLGC